MNLSESRTPHYLLLLRVDSAQMTVFVITLLGIHQMLETDVTESAGLDSCH